MKKVLISGSTGLIGEALVAALRARGDAPVRLVRRETNSPEPHLLWNPLQPFPDPARLEGFAAVVHLAGESVASGRWTAERKRRIRESRTISTRILAETLAGLKAPPPDFLCASAIGYYGSRGDEILDETSAPGDDFLAEVCVGWEAACDPARRAGLRTANLRISIVLAAKGGPLAKMLPLFKFGIAGRLGSGRQWMSWIALEDMIAAILYAIDDDRISGPVNCCAPYPVVNAEFTRTLAAAVRRPAILPAPAWALRLAIGEFADALLGSERVIPRKLQECGFGFKQPRLEQALASLLPK